MSTEKTKKDKNNETAEQTPEPGGQQESQEPGSPNDSDQAMQDRLVQPAQDDINVATQSSQNKLAQDKTGQSNTRPNNTGRSGWVIPLLAMFLLFAGGAVLLWLDQQQLGRQLQQSEQRSAAMQTRLDQSLQQQLEASNANSELQNSIKAMRDLLNAQQQAPQQDETVVLLHQTLMLVRMAQAQIQVRRDVTDAILALQWAQRRLQAHNDARLEPLMMQIDHDLEQLRSIPEHNNLALTQQLSSLIDTVDKLPLRVAAAKSMETVVASEPQMPTPETASDNTDWRSVLQIIRRELEKLVVIRRRDQPLQPLMSVERNQALHDILRLRLETLQVQLMRDEIAAQNVARARALSWLREWFEEADSGVISLRTWLNEIPQTATTLPDLQDSATAVTTAMDKISSLPGPLP